MKEVKLLIIGEYLIPVLTNEVSGEITGSKIAIIEFTKALLKYGTFDELYFIVSPEVYSFHIKNLNKLAFLMEKPERVKIVSLTEINTIKDIKFTALHDPTLIKFEELINFRNTFFNNNFPVTVCHHAISYYQLKPFFQSVLLSDIKEYDSIICTSHAAKTALENIFDHISTDKNKYKGRFDYIPLGIDTDHYKPADKNISRKQLGLPASPVIISYIGRFSEHDKADLFPLLFCFKRAVKNLNTEVLLILSGRDSALPYSEKLKHYIEILGIKNKVLVWKSLPVEKTAILYQASDIFISPVDNVQETFGLTVGEALSSGIPVITTDWNGYRDLVINNKTGFLIKTTMNNNNSGFKATCSDRFNHYYQSQATFFDHEQMVEKLTALITDDKLRQDIGKMARIEAAKNLSWEVIIKKYETVWKNLASSNETQAVSRKNSTIESFYDCFNHYASEQLDPNNKVKRTDTFAEIETRKIFEVITNNEFYSSSEVPDLYDYLKEPEMIKELSQKYKYETINIMLKYGFLKYL